MLEKKEWGLAYEINDEIAGFIFSSSGAVSIIKLIEFRDLLQIAFNLIS